MEERLEYKECRKAFSRLGFCYAIGAVIIIAANAAAVAVVARWRPQWLDDANATLLLSVVSMYLVGMPVLAALAGRLPGRAPQKCRMTFGQFAVACVMCLAILYGSNIIGSILVAVIGALRGRAVDNVVAELAMNANMGLTFVYMVLFAPIAEEYIFRKLIVDKTLRYGQGAAVVLSGVMFGLFHGNLSQFAYAMTMGMFLAFLYAKTGRLEITIAIHMLVNFMGAIVSVLVTRMVKDGALLEMAPNQGAQDEGLRLLQGILRNPVGWAVYLLYAGAIFGLLIAGIVLLIVFRRRFVLDAGEVVLPKGRLCRAMFWNAGMLLYCAIWIGMIVAQL